MKCNSEWVRLVRSVRVNWARHSKRWDMLTLMSVSALMLWPHKCDLLLPPWRPKGRTSTLLHFFHCGNHSAGTVSHTMRVVTHMVHSTHIPQNFRSFCPALQGNKNSQNSAFAIHYASIMIYTKTISWSILLQNGWSNLSKRHTEIHPVPHTVVCISCQLCYAECTADAIARHRRPTVPRKACVSPGKRS